MLKQELSSLIEWQGTIFMHGNVPIHILPKVKNYLQEMSFNILSWSLYSLDLNSIKNCWRALKLNTHQVVLQLPQMMNPKAA